MAHTRKTRRSGMLLECRLVTRLTAVMLHAALAIVAMLILVSGAGAQDYPTRQIVLIVPFPAGGSTDAIARIIAEPLRAILGSPWSCRTSPGPDQRSVQRVQFSPRPTATH